MRGLRVAPVVIVMLTATGVWAQTGDDLNDMQKLGRSLFVQSCGVCHLKPQLTAVQYAPVLSKDSLGGNENAMHAVIANGTPRMPGFKYQFDEDQIAAIAAYLKTLPVAATEAPATKREGRDAD